MNGPVSLRYHSDRAGTGESGSERVAVCESDRAAASKQNRETLKTKKKKSEKVWRKWH